MGRSTRGGAGARGVRSSGAGAGEGTLGCATGAARSLGVLSRHAVPHAMPTRSRARRDPRRPPPWRDGCAEIRETCIGAWGRSIFASSRATATPRRSTVGRRAQRVALGGREHPRLDPRPARGRIEERIGPVTAGRETPREHLDRPECDAEGGAGRHVARGRAAHEDAADGARDRSLRSARRAAASSTRLSRRVGAPKARRGGVRCD